MRKNSEALLFVSLIFVSSTGLSDEWTFGIGTGISALDVDGDAGFHTQLLGPVDFDASLEPDEVREYLDGAIGFGGFAKNGDWTITYSVGQLELEEDVSAMQNGNASTLDLSFTTTGAELLANYTFSKSGDHSFAIIFGARYTDQEYDTELSVNGSTIFDGSVDDNWVDAVIGISHTMSLSRATSWSTQLDYGGGGSEGATHFNTGVSTVFAENWLLSGSLDYKDIEYEEGGRGENNWFFYDAKETILSLGILYLF